MSVDSITGASKTGIFSANGEDVCWDTEMKYVHFGNQHFTSGTREEPASNLVVKEGGLARPISRGEGVLVIALSHSKGLNAARTMDTLFSACVLAYSGRDGLGDGCPEPDWLCSSVQC